MFGIAMGESEPKKPATVGGFYSVAFAALGEFLSSHRESGWIRRSIGERMLDSAG